MIMYLRAVVMGGFIYTLATGQGLQEQFQADDVIEPETIKSIDDFILRPKPWWLKAVTKEWQWVAIDPKIYYPLRLDPLKYPAVIEHEKVHLHQQRSTGKFKWLFKYITNKNFRLDQEMEPIAIELLNTPLKNRKQLAVRYARSLSGLPYLRAAKSYDLALDSILFKIKEMGIEMESDDF